MASAGSQLTQYNHYENQTLKVIMLLNSESVLKSMSPGGPSLRGVYEDLRVLSDNSRTRECWKSHVQKKVKGPEQNKRLVREKGLVGLPLFNDEGDVLARVKIHRALGSHPEAPEESQFLAKRVPADLPNEAELSGSSFLQQFSPSKHRPSSGPLPGPVWAQPVIDQESEVCQSHKPLDLRNGASTDASESAAEKSSAASAGPLEFYEQQHHPMVSESQMGQIVEGRHPPMQIETLFDQAQFGADQDYCFDSEHYPNNDHEEFQSYSNDSIFHMY
jgi:hypothetical protein